MTTPPSSSSSDEPISTKVTTVFQTDIVKEALRRHLSNPKNKINDDAAELVAELMKILVVESSIRAAKQASLQNKSTVTLDHIESVLPQLMLDFP
ncbi:CENP-X domain containing protein [Asbolus verrucosus]|uniref:Centromere protein X n=1 Tax=Asbolus verrucosus TaxID=1661398 RepID=A0A482V8Q1_ASBVE|nr:CENP-X domain containing protein [Asbolus verrucosus]